MTKIAVVRAAPGVEFATIAPGGFRLIAAIDLACQAIGHDLVMTSATDSHTTGRHPKGEAYDLSAKYLTPAQILRLRLLLMQKLGDRFTVLVETPELSLLDPMLRDVAYVNGDATGVHLHTQVKKGTEYPPEGNVNA